MCRGWKGLALLVGYGLLTLPVQAQLGTYPSPVGAARMPVPIPADPSSIPPAPNLVPGPISPLAAPMGPDDSFSLPENHSSAFQTENYVQESGVYLHVGPMALQRNQLGAGDIAVNNAAVQGLPPHLLPNDFAPPPPGTASALNFNSVNPALSMGIRGTVGYLWHDQAIEFSSFYVWQNNVTATANDPHSLDTLFYNPPYAFLGQGLYRLADTVQLTQGSSLFNAEANYRKLNTVFPGMEFLIGARYVRQNDFLSILSQGTSTILPPPGLSIGQDASIYKVITHNNIVAPQMGLEYAYNPFAWLTLSCMGKGAWGVNYLTSESNLTRNDGLIGFNSIRHATVFSQIYELGAFADFNSPSGKMRLRLGYTSTWLCGVADAPSQVNFNLLGAEAVRAFGQANFNNVLSNGNLSQINNAQGNIQHGRVNNDGTILYFGPQIELQFMF